LFAGYGVTSFFSTYCTHSHIHTLAYNLQPVGQFETIKEDNAVATLFLCVSPTYAKTGINLHKQKTQQIYACICTHLNACVHALSHIHMHMALLGANRSESSSRHMQDSPTHTKTQQRSAKTHTAAEYCNVCGVSDCDGNCEGDCDVSAMQKEIARGMTLGA